MSETSGGEVYAKHITERLAAEVERKKTLEGRGTTLVTTSSTLLTIIFALTVFITGKEASFKFNNDVAIWFLLAALLVFVASAVAAIYVQTFAIKYTVTSAQSLRGMVETNHWNDPADLAQRECAWHDMETTLSIRSANDEKAGYVIGSFVLQVAAIFLLGVSLGIELF
ncbi:hypothetical protein DFR67_114164 [Williamsia limnetica]|uniref:Transmembrane protein n=1 Tax=Williamsia limnetica TaxID=882452 RepID=A0A318RJV7_WILLI|nr:hypothetical protein [Williamsia limnetica]PYE14065.1 hypothetical protein DFR67_114164 [Williamsia limnetica]